MEKITSRENAKIKYACRLASSGAFRRSEGKFLAEGRKLCPELCRGAALETLFCTEAALEKCPELAGLPGDPLFLVLVLHSFLLHPNFLNIGRYGPINH